jgi:hypothetical protein
MSGFVASNARYYKATQIAGLTGHVRRQFEHDENVFPELSGENFRHHFATFAELEQRMLEAKSAAGLRARGFQKNANVLVDNILILDRETVEALKTQNPSGYKSQLRKAAVVLSERICAQFGLEPMSIDFHWDEGHHDPESGEFKNNYHAHMSFFNFDFNKLNQPLRSMKRDDFSMFQDLSAEAFEPLGFRRGESKKSTGKKHLDKKDFVNQQLKERLINVNKQIATANATLGQFMAANDDQKSLLMVKIQEIEALTAKEKALKNKVIEVESRRLALEGEFETVKSKLFPVINMAKMLAVHRSDFEAFLGTSPADGIADRLKSAEALIEAHGLRFKSPSGEAVDNFLQIYDSAPELKRF